MENTKVASKNLEMITWGALIIWWGITEMIESLPTGTGLIGIGLILLGVNGARTLSGNEINGFTTTLGILALVWGGLELAGAVINFPFELPVFAILVLVSGLIVMARGLKGNIKQ